MVLKLRNVALPELNESYQKVLYYFFSFPNTETSLNDLSKNLHISKTTAKKIVMGLERKGFLIRKVYGKVWRISCNRSHFYNRSYKIAFNYLMVQKAYNNGIREKIYDVVGNANSIILFGSYSKGDDTEKSDIDIAVETIGNETAIKELGIIPRFGYRRNVSVNLYIFSRNNVDINIFSNIANGILIEGFLEVRP